MAVTTLKPPAFRRQERVLIGARERTAYQELWETPSDPRAGRATVRAWACLQVAYSPGVGQWVPSLRRIYTRTVGEVREVAGTSMQPMRWNFTGLEEDTSAPRLCASRARAFLPELIGYDPIAARIFIPADVLE